MDPEEGASLSLSRKYGYAIMALSVVVLAVLMVTLTLWSSHVNIAEVELMVFLPYRWRLSFAAIRPTQP